MVPMAVPYLRKEQYGLWVAVFLLVAGVALLSRCEMSQRLCGSSQMDISKARTLFLGNPPITVNEGLRRTIQGFLHEKTF